MGFRQLQNCRGWHWNIFSVGQPCSYELLPFTDKDAPVVLFQLACKAFTIARFQQADQKIKFFSPCSHIGIANVTQWNPPGHNMDERAEDCPDFRVFMRVKYRF